MSKTRHSQSINQVRIIGGQWRGRKLRFPTVTGLRPTSDRVRETVFNWLSGEIVGATCLDLFAGSGALGFEALSRGADYCHFVDHDRQVVSHLTACQTLLGCAERSAVLFADASKPVSVRAPADIVFLDPPFAENLLIGCIDWLINSEVLHDESLLYIETAKSTPLHTEQLTTLKQGIAGEVCYRLARLTRC